MTSLLSARRRAEEFAAVVDGTLDPAPRSEFAALAGVASLLRDQQPPTLREEFAADLRARLLAEAATALTPKNPHLVLPARPGGRRERRLVAAATAVVLIGGTAGMATAAEHALPGEALYPVKRAIEHAQAGLSTSSAGRGRDLLAQANDRLGEAAALLDADSPSAGRQVAPTVQEFTAAAQQGAALMMSSFRETRDPATIVAVRRFAAAGLGSLQEMARTAPADSQDDLATAAVSLGNIDQQARDLCADCAADLPDLAVPPTFQAAAEVDRALHDLAGAHLDNSHPVAVDGPVQDARKRAGAGGAPAAGASPSDSATPDTGTGLQTPKVEEQVKKTSTDTGGAVGSTVKKVTDGVGGVVKSLLPDPSSGPLP